MGKKGDRTYERYCVICGKDLTGTRRIKTCDSEECKRANRLHKYQERLHTKTCKYCGKEFLGKDKELLCDECKGKHNAELVKKEQTVICSQCGKEIRRQMKCVTKWVDTIYEVCDVCKKENKIKNSENSRQRMKDNNPMYDKEIAKKVGDTRRRIYVEECERIGKKPSPRQVVKEIPETKEETSIRMHEHNPMYDENIRKQVSETLKEKIANGEIVYKRGSEHPLWKGNRPLTKHVRINLRKWVRMKFEEAHFICQVNGERKCELHVHHLEPLRDIIARYLEKYNTNSQDILKDENLLNEFTNEIVKYHFEHPEIGIVVCPQCHHKIDSHYRRLTYNGNKKNENKKDNKK